jgi:hypothetical protein
VGEELSLRFAPPAGTTLADFSAFALASGEHFAVHHRAGARVRPGPLPWVRFTHELDYQRGVHDLFLCSADGLWGARVRVPPATDEPATDEPATDEPAEVRLEHLGVVRLALRPPADLRWQLERSKVGEGVPRALREAVRVRFERLDTRGTALEVFQGHASPCGSTDFPCLAPGRWRIELRSGFFSDQTVEVELPAGAVEPVDVFLGEPVATGRLVVQVVDANADIPEATRAFDLPSLAAIVRSGDRAYYLTTPTGCGTGVSAHFGRVERDGRGILEAVLEDVPLADYDIELLTGGRRFEGDLRARPGTPARFVLRDKVFGMRVLDRETRRAVPGYRVVDVSSSPRHVLSPTPGEDGVHAREVRGFDIGEWCVVAPGYRRAYGRGSDFVTGPDGAWATVELEHGWAVLVVARQWGVSRRSGRPSEWAAGVPVRLGAESFALDGAGRAVLTAPAFPTSSFLRFEGWEVASGDVDADGRFDPALDVLRVVLRPRD